MRKKKWGREIDFLRPLEPKVAQPKPEMPRELRPLPIKKRRYQKIATYAFVFIGLTAVLFSTNIIISGSEATRSFGGIGILSQLKNLIIKDQHDVLGIKEGRINIVLLGVGGSGHPGAYLTDTIMLVSLKPQDSIASIISIPRDLYITTKQFGGIKINSLYTLQDKITGNRGGELVKEVLGATFNIPIHYYARIDFDGFIELVDAIGGIDVYVDQSFTDYQFPTDDFRTKTVSFKAGLNHFDGITALQFARSRHGTGGEGSDFARARRQQKILIAVKDKLLEAGILIKPNKIFSIVGKSIDTDMELWEIKEFAALAKNFKKPVIQKVLDDSPEGYLTQITGYDGAYLLVPKNSEILQNIAQNIFSESSIENENPTVVIQNGTTVDGFASSIKIELEKGGFTVLSIENASSQSYVSSVIYDFTSNSKPASLLYLKNKLSGRLIPSIPADLWNKYGKKNIDFVVVLGQGN